MAPPPLPPAASSGCAWSDAPRHRFGLPPSRPRPREEPSPQVIASTRIAAHVSRNSPSSRCCRGRFSNDSSLPSSWFESCRQGVLLCRAHRDHASSHSPDSAQHEMYAWSTPAAWRSRRLLCGGFRMLGLRKAFHSSCFGASGLGEMSRPSRDVGVRRDLPPGRSGPTSAFHYGVRAWICPRTRSRYYL